MDPKIQDQFTAKRGSLRWLNMIAAAAMFWRHAPMPFRHNLEHGHRGTPMRKYRPGHIHRKTVRGLTGAQKQTRDYVMREHRLEKRLKRRRQRRMNYRGAV